MTVLSHNFNQAYALLDQNIKNANIALQMPSPRVALYINTCTPGILDVGDLMEAERGEFLQMAYYGLFGHLPEQSTIRQWESEREMSERAYRKAVLDALLRNPEAAGKGLMVRNNIYADDECGQGHMRRSLKQRVWVLGYRVSRRLPLSVKIRLKKLVMKCKEHC